MPFLTKNYDFLDFFQFFPVEVEKLIFQTKWVVLAPKQRANSVLITLKYC